MKPKLKRKMFYFLLFILTIGIGFGIYGQNKNKAKDKEIDQYLATHNIDEQYASMVLEEHTLARKGCNLHFYSKGDSAKPLLLLIHPAFSDHHCFMGQYEAFAQEYFVVGVDLRAHGKSQPIGQVFSHQEISEDIKAIIDHYQKQQCYLVGVSIGGEIIQDFEARYPDRLKASVIAGSVSLFKNPGFMVRMIKSASIKGASMFSGARVKRFMARISSDSIEVCAKFYKSITAVADSNIQVVSRSSASAYKVKEGYKINTPVLLMHGERELKFAQRTIFEWSKELPKGQYAIIKNAGHLVHQENPAMFTDEVLKFFKAID